MCGGQAVGSIFSGIGNIASAQQADAEAKGNAKTVISMAQSEAAKLRRQGKSNASSARTVAAENGLDVDQGAAAMIQDEHISDAEYDASMTVSEAGHNASNIRRAGKMQRNNYSMKAAGNFISAGASTMGWK
ncbi:hypothetical protein IL972_00340 [Acinetobacter sp. FL51]|uniref:hypothetical protein n=1 Tax=Acinetobacter sp. FL51 TaxID=2777978 RepID=UPI0018E1A981|nr:hypothetical protein [Acinetobacter sp. FL51]MBI1450386.1 hypothetical protein [Acinetobacter sp. FL51]